MPSENNITVTFTHPRSSSKLAVEIGTGLTGEKAIEELVKAGFIEASPAGDAYSLVIKRTSRNIPLSVSLVDSGVKDGDVVAIVQASEGAA